MPRQNQYQVIARKYRPQRFSQVVGQECVVETLKNALKKERIAHAYLFAGPHGTGKTSLARLLSKVLNCENVTGDQEPCGICSSCKETSLDLIEIDGASNRGIDDVRQINENAQYAPSSGKYKIYLIDEVHMLTKEAFNALLKTLEEPPPSVKFFFATTEPHKLPATILSRCQRFDLRLIDKKLLTGKLRAVVEDLGLLAEEEALSQIADVAAGSLRDAETLLDQFLTLSEGKLTAEAVVAHLGLVPESFFARVDLAIETGDLNFAITAARELFESGKDPLLFLEKLILHFRNHLIQKTGHPEERCLYILDYLTEWLKTGGKLSLGRIGFEMLLLHLIRSKDRITIDSLVFHLSELEKKMALPLQQEEPIPHTTQNSAETRVLSPVEYKVDNQPLAAPPPIEPPKVTPPSIKPVAPQQKLETLLRFAAVELEGVIRRA